jgi:exosortase C (VPDSG-CTERM-specific)
MTNASAQSAFGAAQIQKFALAAGLVTAGFAIPLWRLLRFSLGDDLHSYIPLMPFVSLYLAWTQKAELPKESSPVKFVAGLFFAAGAVAAAGYVALARSSAPGSLENCLSLGTLAWLLCLSGAGCFFLGGAAMRALVFPFFLLGFMIPFPVAARDWVETALQHGSAEVADWMFMATGMPFMRDGMNFHLPGITFEVAPECSGIHSTLVLFITSLVAGKMILSRPWKRAALCLAVIPLALLRNGFRVFVIGELCVHVGPQMIDSPIHHHGGPIFFVLSLVPFFLLLYFLKKGEQTKSNRQVSNSDK